MAESLETAGQQDSDYLAYLMRLWRMVGEGAGGWRASLASPGAGEPLTFASLVDLFVFLRSVTGIMPEAEGIGEAMQS